jgi:hypothetical protein
MYMKPIFFQSFCLVALALTSEIGLASEKVRLDDAARTSIVSALTQKITEEYVFPDKAKLIVDLIREKEKKGAYRGIEDVEQLASVLTTDLRQPTNDLHLNVRASAQPIPERTGGDAQRTPEMDKIMLARFKSANFGVRKIEALPGNIGYIDLRMFPSIWFSEEAISAAMSVVGDTDALIIDLRNNSGGDPNTVAFMSSYLFEKRTHLNDMYWRKDNRTVEFWTTENVPGKRFGGTKKIYILTSKKTFSGAEEFTYNMKQLKRATIIGETTAGGAHPGGGHRLHPHLSVFIPNGRPINPVSKTNWEGTGVTPDIQVAADEALRVAERKALQDLLVDGANVSDAARAGELRKRLEELGN